MIDFDVEKRVARLVLQRPSASNAFTGDMLRQLLAALTRAAAEADILAISAAGADFSLGRDRQDVKAGPPPFEAFKLITDVNAALSAFPGSSRSQPSSRLAIPTLLGCLKKTAGRVARGRG